MKNIKVTVNLLQIKWQEKSPTILANNTNNYNKKYLKNKKNT
jgi:hypothetical protein